MNPSPPRRGLPTPVVILGTLALAVLAIVFIDPSPGPRGSVTTDGEQVGSDDERLARAMCSDVSGGASLFQMHSQAVEYYREIGRSEDAAQYAAATLEDLATREYCPDLRDEFEATIVYEQWIAP